MGASPHRQRGVALLVALLVVALATILIAALLDRGELTFARTRNALRSEQAEAYAQGLEIYAAEALRKTKDEGRDTNSSPWAMPLPTQPVPGGLIGASMRDRNGCFNLNNLAPPSASNPYRERWDKIFENLLKRLGLPDGVRPAIEAWLDPGQAPTEANFYLAQPVPYRPRSGLFAHVSELRLVRGVTGEIYARLAPHVCALPQNTKLNINTATMPLLWSLADDGALSQADAERLWSGGQANYGDLKTFMDDARLKGNPVEEVLDTSSRYFLARSDIVLDAVPFTFYSLIERRDGSVRVLQRSRGADDALVAPAPVAPEESP